MEQTRGTSEPIRVVLFGGGPVLERGVKQFICQLELHPEIVFLAAFCQSETQSFRAVFNDLWRRRRLLAFPLLLIRAARRVRRYLVRPDAQADLDRTIAHLADRIHYVPDIHAGEVLESVRALQPELGLIYGSPILRPELFEIPALGTLGIHHGKVPEYRGKKTMFWAMYYDEETAGVTIQKVNAGLDTGQVVKEGEVPIGRRSQRAVWTDLEALGFSLYVQAILEVKAGTATYEAQVGGTGKVYGDPKLSDILRFWLKRSLGRLSRAQYNSTTPEYR